MFELRFPTKIIFGRNSVDRVGAEASEYGDKALLVTGRWAMHKAKVIDRMMDLLKVSEFKGIYLYDKVEHDPSIETVDQGTELARKCQADLVIGIGGGSALDAAKAIACMVKNEGSVVEYQSGRQIEHPGIPFIAIPTTAGTGAEITRNAVLTNREKKVKESIRSTYMIAKVAIVDAVLTATMPPAVTAATGMDALTQAIEAYVTLASNPVADALALRSIALISQSLTRAYDNGDDMEARENMALGSLMGAMAFANSSLGAVHGLAHPIGAMFDVSHGVICALLLPHVMEYNLPERTTKYAQIAEAMGQDIKDTESEDSAARMAIEAVRDLLSRLRMPQRLRDVGIGGDSIAIIAESARGSSLNNNPRSATSASLKELLLAAL